MSKNIVLLSDGTGQRGGVGYETSIWRLYKALKINDEQQMVCYDDGVGSQKFRLAKILGSMAAIGLDQNVRVLYSFLIRHWEPGDRIYLFGFSRGAFTVRILSDIIARCGVINLHEIDSEKELSNLVKTAYSACLKAYYHPEYAKKFKEQFSRKEEAKIQFIGVWDTVGAIGIPFKEARFAMHNWIKYGFRGHALNNHVLCACHAISIDDCRETFHPVVWDERIDERPGRINQVWFSGMHSNVGGGYPKNQLSRVALEWMIEQVQTQDVKTIKNSRQCLQFNQGEVDSISQEKNAHGRLYNSRSGLASAYRFLPRDMEFIRQSYTEKNAIIHPSVFARIEQYTDAYSPHNLTDNFESKELGKDHGDTEITNTWRECMKVAGSYSYLQQIIYDFFMLPIAAFIFLILWEFPVLVYDFLITLFCGFQETCSVYTSDSWYEFLDSANDVFYYSLIGVAILGLSEVIQFPFRSRQNKLASQGWSSTYPKARINDVDLLETTRSSKWVRLSDRLKKYGVRKKINSVVTLVTYVFVYTLGFLYWLKMFFSTHFRLKRIDLSSSNLVEPCVGKPQKIIFETNMYRMNTGLSLRKGQNYKIVVEKYSGWFDKSYPATPEGLIDPQKLPLKMKLARKKSRLPAAEIFTLLGEVEKNKPFQIGLQTTYTCSQSGELVFYVNDTHLCWPLRDIFYLNNRGSARICVEVIQS
jgi:hypothetical protein